MSFNSFSAKFKTLLSKFPILPLFKSDLTGYKVSNVSAFNWMPGLSGLSSPCLILWEVSILLPFLNFSLIANLILSGSSFLSMDNLLDLVTSPRSLSILLEVPSELLTTST